MVVTSDTASLQEFFRSSHAYQLPSRFPSQDVRSGEFFFLLSFQYPRPLSILPPPTRPSFPRSFPPLFTVT